MMTMMMAPSSLPPLSYVGIKGIIFDKDNTLTAPYNDVIHPSVVEGFNTALRVFGNRTIIISNSAGTKDDPGDEE